MDSSSFVMTEKEVINKDGTKVITRTTSPSDAVIVSSGTVVAGIAITGLAVYGAVKLVTNLFGDERGLADAAFGGETFVL